MKCFAKNSSIADFLRPSSKNKKSSYNFLYLKKKKSLSGSNIKKFLIFSQKKTFPIFREMETPKNISGNETF